jgi:hypothetical protein
MTLVTQALNKLSCMFLGGECTLNNAVATAEKASAGMYSQTLATSWHSDKIAEKIPLSCGGS